MSNEPKHTATPWHHHGLLVKDSQNRAIAYLDSIAEDAARIVQCVNACEGLDDPERYFRQMKESGVLALWNDFESLRAENAELIEALRAGRNELERAKMSLIQCGYGIESSTIQSIQYTIQTLTKYENK